MATLSVLFKAVDEISSRFNSMTQSGERMLDAFENAGSTADQAISGISQTADGTAQSLQSAADATDHWTDAVGNYDKGALEAIYSTEELVEMGFKTEDALNDAADAADGAAEQMEDFGESAEEAGKKGEEGGKKAADGIQTLSGILASAGIVAGLKEIADGFMDCSAAAGEFETSVAKVATIADTSEKSLANISSEIMSYSNETGEAATDLAEATYQAISAGVNTAESVSFAGNATKLAVGGFTQAATAVDVLTTAINAYGLEASDATYISDLLITTQNLGKTSVDQLSSSVGKVIPLASAYGVEMDNLSSAYAVLTLNGIATAEAGTYLKAMLNELGDSSSEVAGVLQEETGQSFAELMNAGYSLGDVLAILGEGVGNDQTAFNALWSSTEAGIGALGLFNAGADKFNSVLGSMQDSAGATEKAYTTMANTTERSKQRMETAFDNLKIAAGTVLNPALTSVYDTFANIFAGMSDFVNEHPAVVAAVTAIAVGVGVFAAGLAAYTLASNAATVATAAWNAVLNANPVFLVITGVVALTTAVVALVSVLASQNDEYEEMTATSKDQYDQLQSLNAEYEEACAKYGETSEEASRLRYQMDDLNAEFEANRQTVEEFVAECDALVDSHNNLMQSYSQTTTEIKQNELGTLALIQKLQDLATQNDNVAGSEEQMKAIITQLNKELPDLSLSYDDVTTNVESMVEAMKKAAEAQAEQEAQAERQETYVELLKEQAVLNDEIAKAEANLNSERERHGMYFDETINGWRNDWYAEDSLYAGWTTDLQEYGDALDELNAAYAENQATLAEIEGEWTELAEAEAEAVDQGVSYEEAVGEAVESVQAELEELCEAYDAAYEAAYESLDSQIGLFDTMKTETELSVADMQAALESQAEYINLYTENLQKAAQYGLDDGLIQSLSDGSEESAGYINAIIENIEALGGSAESMPAEAAAFVDDFNAKFSEVSQAKDDFATNVAQMETDFDAKMTEIENKMTETVAGMNMSTDAAAAARETIQAYCDTIRSMTGEASSAAAAVAQAAKSQLSGISVPSITGHATGTISAQEDAYIAGENGPELILGARGSEVFPAEETNRIISAVEDRPVETSAPPSYPRDSSEGDNGDGRPTERTIRLEINGGGAIEVGRGTDRGTVLDILTENIKPVLMSLIQEEIYEEGDLAYDY